MSPRRHAALALAALLLILPISGTVCLAMCPAAVAGQVTGVTSTAEASHCHEDAVPAGDGIAAAVALCFEHQSPSLQGRDATRPTRADVLQLVSSVTSVPVFFSGSHAAPFGPFSPPLSAPPLLRPAAPLVLRL